MGEKGTHRIHEDDQQVLILTHEALASAKPTAPGNWLGVFPFGGAAGGAAVRAVQEPRLPGKRPGAVDAYYSDGGHMSLLSLKEIEQIA